jgi:hypothetical protein
MAKDGGTESSIGHVLTEETGVGAIPLRGVANTGTNTARLEVADTGVETWQYKGPFIPLAVPVGSTNDNPAGYRMFDLIRDSTDYTQAHTTLTEWDETFNDYNSRHDVVASRGFMLKAERTNTDAIWVGNDQMFHIAAVGTPSDTLGNPSGSGPAWRRDASNVHQTTLGAATPMGFPLYEGESMFIEIQRATQIYLTAVTATVAQTLYWIPI